MTAGCGIDAAVGTTPPVAAGSESHANVRQLVDAFGPSDERSEEAKKRFLAELDRLERPCDREADPVHVTASAIVVGRRGTVLHLHRKARRWLQPGGHVDAGESPEQAARRETLEETGLGVEHPPDGPRVIHLDVHPAQQHLHLDLRYLLLAPDADPAPGPGESPDVRWFGWDEAEAVADPGLVAALRAARTAWESGSLRASEDGGSAGGR